jgi:nucleoid DNA-binding protein
MKKTELIKAVAKKADYTTASVREMLTALEEVVVEALKKSGRVEIPGVVILKLAHTKARKAGTRTIFGVTRKVGAKAAGLKVKARVKKTVQEQVTASKKRR